MQVLTWAVVGEHERSVAALEEALASRVPQRLAEAEQRAGELQTQYDALKQSADEKVRGGAGRGLLGKGIGSFVSLLYIWGGCCGSGSARESHCSAC